MNNKETNFERVKEILLTLALIAFLTSLVSCKQEQFEKITIINGAVPVYMFTIPEGDSIGNYTKLTAQFLVDEVNYRKQARVRAYGVYPSEYFEDIGNIVFLDFSIGATDKNGPYLLSNVIGTNRNLPIVSKDAGANKWFTIEFPLNGMQHGAYNYENFPDSSANGDLIFALGLGTGSATADFTYYAKEIALENDDGSKKIISAGSGFNKPTFAGYPQNTADISRVKTSKIEKAVFDGQYDDPSGYYQVRKVNSWLFSIYDPDSVYCYLLVGEERAILYDTVYGIGYLPGVVSKLTDKPVTVVVSHGHADHVNGAYQFNEAWLYEKDFELAQTAATYRTYILEGLAEDGQVLPIGFDPDYYINAGAGNFKNLEIGQIFDLGGMTVEVIAAEGHTAGSIGLLVREHRVYLNSDSANFNTWMFLPESLSMKEYIAMLERTIQLEFDTFFIGHSDAPMTKDDYRKILNVARNATLEKALPYGQRQHLNPVVYQEDNVAVIFSAEKMR